MGRIGSIFEEVRADRSCGSGLVFGLVLEELPPDLVDAASDNPIVKPLWLTGDFFVFAHAAPQEDASDVREVGWLLTACRFYFAN